MTESDGKSYFKRTPHGSIHNINDVTTSITGSLHTLEFYISGHLLGTLMIDAGMFSGSGEVTARNNALPIDSNNITSTILTHNHADHSGRIPTTVKEGNTGKIFMTNHSHEAFNDIQEDSLFVQMKEIDKKKDQRAIFGKRLQQAESRSESERTEKQKELLESLDIKKNSDIKRVLDEKFNLTPLFTQEDLDKTHTQIKSYSYNTDKNPNKFQVFPDSDVIQARFLEAGHIFGSAMTLLEITKKNSKKVFNVLRGGDLGRLGNRIYGNSPSMGNLRKPLDAIFLEATYGGKNHPDIQEELTRKYKTINEVFAKGGSAIQALFTQDRFQLDLLYDLDAIDNGQLSKDTVIVADSPLAKRLAKIMSKSDPIYNRIISHPNIFWTEKEQAEFLLLSQKPNHIFKMSGGMLQGGTIMKLIKYFDKQNKDIQPEYKGIAEKGMVIMTGHIPEYTLGWKIKTDANSYNSESFNFSSHIDHNGIIDFVMNTNGESGIELRKDAKICLMHGEIGSMYKIRDSLVEKGIDPKNIIIPVQNGTSFDFPIK